MSREHEQPREENTPDLLLTEENSGSHYNIERLKTIQISLDENPSTGYLWNVADLDPNMLQITRETFIMTGDNRVIGAGGIKRYEVKTLQPGETSLSFKCKRPWIKDDDKDAEVFNISLTIN